MIQTRNLPITPNYNFIIDNEAPHGNYFGSGYTKTFNVPKSGYYIIHDNWCGIFNRVANDIQTMTVSIDGTVMATYRYASVPSDVNWGTSRRTITGQDFLVYLTAGEHTLSTEGNLYWDSVYYPRQHYIYAEFFMEDNQ